MQPLQRSRITLGLERQQHVVARVVVSVWTGARSITGNAATAALSAPMIEQPSLAEWETL
jgi:hypothetical protein